MTEQQRPDEDVEGHVSKFRVDPEGVEEDVEGHKHMLDEGSTDDVAGHGRYMQSDEGDEGDDVGGHQWTRQ
jgi:hypothetical protein